MNYTRSKARSYFLLDDEKCYIARLFRIFSCAAQQFFSSPNKWLTCIIFQSTCWFPLIRGYLDKIHLFIHPLFWLVLISTFRGDKSEFSVYLYWCIYIVANFQLTLCNYIIVLIWIIYTNYSCLFCIPDI